MWLAVVATLALLPRLSLVVSPRLFMEGHAVRLECRIARHPDNRWMELGVVDVTSSFRELEGTQSQVVYSLLLEHLGCGEWEAYCQLGTTRGQQRVREAVTVVGCVGGG